MFCNLSTKRYILRFISVRCVGHLLTTHVVENTRKPVFNTKMQFPITFPLMHDKIVMRIWDKNRIMADTFIARIPEKPEDNDFFNITSLQSRGNSLPFRWVRILSHTMLNLFAFISFSIRSISMVYQGMRESQQCQSFSMVRPLSLKVPPIWEEFLCQ